MNAETQQQLDELAELKEAHRRRLRPLQLRAAQLGADAPPQLQNEIDDIEATIATLDESVVKLHIQEANKYRKILNYQGGDTNEQLGLIGEYMVHIEDSLRTEVSGLYRLLHQWREKETSQRIHRQRQTNWFYLLIIILFAVNIFIALIK